MLGGRFFSQVAENPVPSEHADVGPPSARRSARRRTDVGRCRPDLRWASYMSACTENQPRPCRFRADVGPILLADLGPICKSGRRRHDIFPLSPRLNPNHRPTFSRAKAEGGPIPFAHADRTCRADVGPACSRRQPDMTPPPYLRL